MLGKIAIPAIVIITITPAIITITLGKIAIPAIVIITITISA